MLPVIMRRVALAGMLHHFGIARQPGGIYIYVITMVAAAVRLHIREIVIVTALRKITVLLHILIRAGEMVNPQ